MRKLTSNEENEIWEEVKKEFPHDKMMQNIHYVRMKYYILTKDMPFEEKIKFLRSQIPVST